MSFLPFTLSEDGSPTWRGSSSTQWFTLETYKQILPLSGTCLFYILAVSWNPEPSQDFSTASHSTMANYPFSLHEKIR